MSVSQPHVPDPGSAPPADFAERSQSALSSGVEVQRRPELDLRVGAKRGWRIEEWQGRPVRPWLARLMLRAAPFVVVAGVAVFLELWSAYFDWGSDLSLLRIGLWVDLAALAVIFALEGVRLWRHGEPGDGAVFAFAAIVGVPVAVLGVMLCAYAVAAAHAIYEVFTTM